MAVYKKLLFEAGGGIISHAQQAEQVKNTATILIGLGGTGIDCLRTIKTQVYTRLKPDDAGAAMPTYEHIRFLGVDSVEMERGGGSSTEDSFNADQLLPLEDSEFFSIANQNLRKALQNHMALELRPEMTWLEYENIPSSNLGMAGVCGKRQAGRYLMMDKSRLFMDRIWHEIDVAARGLAEPAINVHIFTGLSGGTGSGSFLDVCYMVRSIADKVGGVNMFGYFFLPDVNLSRIPLYKISAHRYLPERGYVAMQELDYCMQLPLNGGSIVQEYQGLQRIEWKSAPVDLCHLISATDSKGELRPNGYDYAMNVTAEYLMEFLTSAVDGESDFFRHLTDYRRMALQRADAGKKNGSLLDYCVIGGACARLPFREINTYLVAEVFHQFGRMTQNMPAQEAAQTLAIRSFAPEVQNIDDVYDSLLHQIYRDAGDNFAPYADDYKYVRNNGDRELLAYYADQRVQKEKRIDINAQRMMAEDKEGSLIRSLRKQLDEISKDINRGPMYVYCMISVAEPHSLLCVIDSLIRENMARLCQEKAQTSLRKSDYENTKAAFERRPWKRRFRDYEFYLCEMVKHQVRIHAYVCLYDVLRTLRKQVEDAAASYYIKLNRVMSTLIDTFRENRDALVSEKILKSENSFAIPMMTIEELKQSLDAEITRLDIPSLMYRFIGVFLNHEEEWIDENESRIAKLVTDFFVETAFPAFSKRTITEFLKDKYNLSVDSQLADRIYGDWVKLLCGKSKPLFAFNEAVWEEEQTTKLSRIFVPTISTPVKAAAQMMDGNMSGGVTWGTRESALNDCIYAMCIEMALPLSAYKNCGKYEQQALEASEDGRHCYEGKAVEQVGFDWRDLPSVIPQSRIDFNVAPYFVRRLIQAGRDLFEEAEAYGMFDEHNVICTVPDAALEDLREITKRCEEFAESTDSPAKKGEKEQLLARLADAKKLPVVPTSYRMPDDGCETEKRTVLEDHFVSSPVYQKFVREEIDKRKAACAAADAAAEKLSRLICV